MSPRLGSSLKNILYVASQKVIITRATTNEMRCIDMVSGGRSNTAWHKRNIHVHVHVAMETKCIMFIM